MTVAIAQETVVTDIPLNDVNIRFRLRTPKEEKIKELAESMKTLGLLNPITIDNKNFLISGYHRLSSAKLLGWPTIPAIVKDFSPVYAELGEIDENLKRSALSKIEVAEHMVRREELYTSLGMRTRRGFNSDSEGLITTDQLAEEANLSNRAYRLKRQPAKIVDDVKDELRDSKWAEVLMDMVKLSQQTPEVQRKVSQLLISGKCSTFKRAFVEGNIQVMRRTKDYKIDFDMKERWGTPHSIMRFTKANIELQSLCDLVAKDEELEWVKRDGLHFGETKIPVYQMAADHAEFLTTYYTPENGLILDQFMGRATNGLAALYHGRKFVGYDVEKKNIDRSREIMNEHFDSKDFQLFHSDGITLEEFKNESEYFDAVNCDPPYVLQAEKYTTDKRDLSNVGHEEYMERIYTNFKQLYRLIKKSNFEQKIFHPVIFKVGTGRRGTNGIIDMDSDFQLAAKHAGFVLWDKVFNQLHSPMGAVNWERNYLNKYVQKNYEVNLVFCKF